MKILHLLYESRGDIFGIGGVGERAYRIYGLIKAQHEITLLCKRYPGAVDCDIDGLRHIFVGSESSSFTKTLLSYAASSAAFVRDNAREFDIIVEDFSPAIPSFIHLFTAMPVILQVQGYTGSYYFRKYNTIKAAILYGLEHMRPHFYRHFIFMNEMTRERLLMRRIKSFSIIPNGIDRRLLDVKPEEGDYILYLGRIDPYSKGLDVLLEAYRLFHSRHPNIRLVIAGRGRDEGRFRLMLNRLDPAVRDGIELAGWADNNKKSELLRGCLFYVFPSRHETQGITVLEAMACAKSSVVSDIPELNYAPQSGGALTFKSGSAQSLLDAMTEMLTGVNRVKMGICAREWVSYYTWDRIAERFEDFLLKVIKGA